MKKIHIELLELETLGDLIGLSYGTLKVYVARKIKNNEPLEFGPNGRYKLFGEPHKKWFAYDSERYAITIKTPTAKPES